MNTLLPVFLNLRRRPALVVGGGPAAEQKVRVLLGAGARVTVIAERPSGAIETLAEEGTLTVHRREYRRGDVDSYAVVIGATDDPSVQRLISEDARERNIPVNIVDTPDLCTFFLSSVFHRGDLKIAVSTNGRSPTLGKIIREAIANEFAHGYPEILETVGELRPDILRTLPDFESRKKLYEELVRSELERRSLYPGRKVERTPTGHAGEGKVYLVGAGPGDPDLITVKGLRILREAEVVLHDALVSREILQYVPGSAEKIDVGKRAGTACVRQADINDLMIREARAGKRVVRLKAGDPFVFGRGGEELEALREAGIEAEVVPGITAGVGVSASLGIPLTHRTVSSSVVFLTGHEDPAKDREHVDWEHAARIDTLVIYMGVRKLTTIVRRLLRHGVPPGRPVAVVFDGTLPRQTVIAGTLEDIEARVRGHSCDVPGLIVVGEVVRFLDLQNTQANLAMRGSASVKI
jgi:uroporphyrin-III C-methyltransferase/precorrin-2 dehydrogenase/sirohydrochlorin ferrochelatase